MSVQNTTNLLQAAALTLFIGAATCGPARSAGGESEEFGVVPSASCGPQDRPESVQGQTTLAERFRPALPTAYNCNLELVGHFEGEGASADMEAFESCAYYTTALNPKMQHPGVAVLDVSTPQQPRAVRYLDTKAMLFAHESLEVAHGRKLLIGSRPPSTFDIYDLSDCRHPILKTSTSLSGAFSGIYSHVGQFSPNGMTFYGAKWPVGREAAAAPPPPSALFALDMSDPSNPRGIALWTPTHTHWITHTVSINEEETRAYLGVQRLQDDQVKSPHPNGLVILDISDVRARQSNPQMRVVSTLFWDDAHVSSVSVPAKIAGRQYLIFSDALGAIGLKSPPPANVCDSGRPGHGFTRIIDISNDKEPKIVSKLILEVAAPKNCSNVMHDPTIPGGYGSFGCSVDDRQNARLLACGQHEAGVRVFDIRDPNQPREVAYYKPRARRTENRLGSLWRSGGAASNDLTADSVIVIPSFRNNAQEIWFTSTDNGFQIVRFTDHFKTSRKDLFLN